MTRRTSKRGPLRWWDLHESSDGVTWRLVASKRAASSDGIAQVALQHPRRGEVMMVIGARQKGESAQGVIVDAEVVEE